MPMKDAKVLIEGLRKEFDHNVVAVDGFDLHVEEGMFISLLGPSGCGKTTTLRMIAGLEKPTSGRIVVTASHVRGPPHAYAGKSGVWAWSSRATRSGPTSAA